MRKRLETPWAIRPETVMTFIRLVTRDVVGGPVAPLRSLRALALFLFSSFAAAQTVTVSASHLGGSAPITGVITFQPTLCDAANTPASARLSGGNGITARQPLTAPVTAGAFTLQHVIDSSASIPINIGYSVSVRTSNGLQALGPGFGCVQPAASNTWCASGVCNFDNYSPTTVPLALQTTGPVGPQGAPGVSSLAQIAATYARLPLGSANVMRAATTANYYVNSATGALGPVRRVLLNRPECV